MPRHPLKSPILSAELNLYRAHAFEISACILNQVRLCENLAEVQREVFIANIKF